MKGNPQVIDKLNDLLGGELTAVDQYFVHSRIYRDWGLQKLHDRIAGEMGDEIRHADMLIKRILFLGSLPDLSTRSGVSIGQTVPEILRNDLKAELEIVDNLREAIRFCEACQDFQTRAVLEEMLKDTEEDHTQWLEQQLGLIDMIGLENYLQSQA